MSPEVKSGKLEQDRSKLSVEFASSSTFFDFCHGPSNLFLRQVACEDGKNTAEKKEVSILTADPKRIPAVFF